MAARATRRNSLLRVEIYVEGAPEHLASECRKAFQAMFLKVGLAGRLPRVIPCGGRQEAYKDFCLASQEPGKIVLLLVDSEERIADGHSKRSHVLQRTGDQWPLPNGATEDSLYFMVEAMESWLLGDTAALSSYFRVPVNHVALPPAGNWELKSKADLTNRLNAIARNTPKNEYKKGRDSFKILAMVNPQTLQQLPHAAAFFRRLLAVC